MIKFEGPFDNFEKNNNISKIKIKNKKQRFPQANGLDPLGQYGKKSGIEVFRKPNCG